MHQLIKYECSGDFCEQIDDDEPEYVNSRKKSAITVFIVVLSIVVICICACNIFKAKSDAHYEQAKMNRVLELRKLTKVITIKSESANLKNDDDFVNIDLKPAFP